MKKYILYLILIIAIFLFCFFSNDNRRKKQNHQYMKEYFLTCYITHSLGVKNVTNLDSSHSLYNDLTCYTPIAYLKVDSLAYKLVNELEPSNIEGDTIRKAIFFNAIEYYHSKELDTFIKSLDKYLCEDI